MDPIQEDDDDDMDIGVLNANGGAAVRTSLVERFAHVLVSDSKLSNHVDPFHVHLLHQIVPGAGTHTANDTTAGATPLDLSILQALYDQGIEQCYWRVIYNLEYRRRHDTWPSGFGGMPKEMRRWYRHVLAAVTVTDDRGPPHVNIDLFPLVADWKHMQAHPVEILSARLLLYVLTLTPKRPSSIIIQWPEKPKIETLRVVLHQLLRQRHGLALNETFFHLPRGSIHSYRSVICAWLTTDTPFYNPECTAEARDHVDNWLDALGVPIAWYASALLVQQRLHLLTDEELCNVLIDFLLKNTSLPVMPRPAWIDDARVRAMLTTIVEKRLVPLDAFQLNMASKKAGEQSQMLDLLTTIKELEPFIEETLADHFEQMNLGKK